MSTALPTKTDDFINWRWEKIEPHYRSLLETPLQRGNLEQWLDGWTLLHSLIGESYARLHVAAAQDTRDQEEEKKYQKYVEHVYLASQPFEQELKRKLIESGLQPERFERPLANMRSDMELFREENLPLFAESEKLSSRYAKIIGAQTVTWKGEELTLQQMRPILQGSDRPLREKAWRLMADRQLADRSALNELWIEFLQLRNTIAGNAGKVDDRGDYRG